MELESEEIERLYLELSRECHPDHQRQASAEEQVAVLQRSAQLNDAYRIVVNPWRRAEAILELRDPGVSDRTKTLSPQFLMEALELSEEAAEAPAERIPELLSRFEAALTEDLDAIRRDIGAENWEAAATRLHQSVYHRKALEDLKARS